MKYVRVVLYLSKAIEVKLASPWVTLITNHQNVVNRSWSSPAVGLLYAFSRMLYTVARCAPSHMYIALPRVGLVRRHVCLV